MTILEKDYFLLLIKTKTKKRTRHNADKQIDGFSKSDQINNAINSTINSKYFSNGFFFLHKGTARIEPNKTGHKCSKNILIYYKHKHTNDDQHSTKHTFVHIFSNPRCEYVLHLMKKPLTR